MTGFVSDYLLHFSKATLSLRALSASHPYDQMVMLHTLSLPFSTLTFDIAKFLTDSLSIPFLCSEESRLIEGESLSGVVNEPCGWGLLASDMKSLTSDIDL